MSTNPPSKPEEEEQSLFKTVAIPLRPGDYSGMQGAFVKAPIPPKPLEVRIEELEKRMRYLEVDNTRLRARLPSAVHGGRCTIM